MVMAEKIRKLHPCFDVSQYAEADGKDAFIHHKKKRSYMDRFFFVLSNNA